MVEGRSVHTREVFMYAVHVGRISSDFSANFLCTYMSMHLCMHVRHFWKASQDVSCMHARGHGIFSPFFSPISTTWCAACVRFSHYFLQSLLLLFYRVDPLGFETAIFLGQSPFSQNPLPSDKSLATVVDVDAVSLIGNISARSFAGW